MRRRLISILAALSIGLAFSTGALWIRSYFRFDTLAHFGSGSYLWIESKYGNIAAARVTDPHALASGWWHEDCAVGNCAPSSALDAPSFRVTRTRLFGNQAVATAVPIWLLFMLSLVIPMIRCIGRRRVSWADKETSSSASS
jgi:hypothetical protein